MEGINDLYFRYKAEDFSDDASGQVTLKYKTDRARKIHTAIKRQIRETR